MAREEIPQPLPPVGSQVVALTVIYDEASNREIGPHAQPGEVGTIAGYHGGDHVPTVTWPGGGTYDSPWSDIRPQDPPWRSHMSEGRRPVPIIYDPENPPPGWTSTDPKVWVYSDPTGYPQMHIRKTSEGWHYSAQTPKLKFSSDKLTFSSDAPIRGDITVASAYFGGQVEGAVLGFQLGRNPTKPNTPPWRSHMSDRTPFLEALLDMSFPPEWARKMAEINEDPKNDLPRLSFRKLPDNIEGLQRQGFTPTWSALITALISCDAVTILGGDRDALRLLDQLDVCANPPRALVVGPLLEPRVEATETPGYERAVATLNTLFNKINTNFPEWSNRGRSTTPGIRSQILLDAVNTLIQHESSRRGRASGHVPPVPTPTEKDLMDLGMSEAWAQTIADLQNPKHGSATMPPFELDDKRAARKENLDDIWQVLKKKISGLDELDPDAPPHAHARSIIFQIQQLDAVSESTRALLDAAAEGGLNGLQADRSAMEEWTIDGWPNSTKGEDLPKNWQGNLRQGYRNARTGARVWNEGGWRWGLKRGNLFAGGQEPVPTRHDAYKAADTFAGDLNLEPVRTVEPEVGHGSRLFGPRIKNPRQLLISGDEVVRARYPKCSVTERASSVYWEARGVNSAGEPVRALWIRRPVADLNEESYWLDSSGNLLEPYTDPETT